MDVRTRAKTHHAHFNARELSTKPTPLRDSSERALQGINFIVSQVAARPHIRPALLLLTLPSSFAYLSRAMVRGC